MRGDLLPFWQPDGPLDPADRRRWAVAAERIATGVVELAHVDAFVDAARCRVGFPCRGDVDLAAAYVAAIRRENVEARQAARKAPTAADPAPPRDEVLLPCRLDATDEEVRHAVLAALKASHALEFGGEHEAIGRAADD